MSREATIEIASMDGKLLVRLLKSSVPYDQMLEYQLLPIVATSLPPLTDLPSVASYGQTLRTALSAHVAVKAELQQLLLEPAPGVASLDFSIGTPGGEDVRWETLCENPTSFWALSATRHLKRVVRPTSRENLGLRMFSKPVRMAAFLSPAAIKSKSEFEAIASAIQAARTSGLDIKAVFYLGEWDLIVEKRAEIEAGLLSGIEIRPIPSDSVSIENALKQDQPQIIHFFCHGHAAAGVQLLEFASINDNDIEASAGSIQLSIERLATVLVASGSAWLTILNSCSGVQSAPRLWSMACALARAASPCVIGMAEPIKADDATLFAKSFYPKMFENVALAITGLPQGSAASIEVCSALAHARAMLHQAAIAEDAAEQAAGRTSSLTFGRWSLPTLYQWEGGLRVASVDSDLRIRIETVAQALRSLPSNTPPRLRDGILALLDQAPPVPQSLRPDRSGKLT